MDELNAMMIELQQQHNVYLANLFEPCGSEINCVMTALDSDYIGEMDWEEWCCWK